MSLGIEGTLEIMYEGHLVSTKGNELYFYNSFKPATFKIEPCCEIEITRSELRDFLKRKGFTCVSEVG